MSESIDIPRPDVAAAPAGQVASGVGPGWYPDPAKPGFERRWDGAMWVGTSHNAANPNAMFGPGYLRAYWVNANRILHMTRTAGLVTVGAFVAYLIIASSTTYLWPPQRPLLAVLAIVGAIAGVAGIVTAGIGVSRAGHLGGMAVAISALVADAILVLFHLGLFALVAFTVV